MGEYNGRKLSLALTALAVLIYSVASYVFPYILKGMGLNGFSAVFSALLAVILLTGGAAVAHVIKFDGTFHYILAICLNASAAGSMTAVYTVGLNLPFSLLDVTIAALAVLAFAAVNALVGRATDGKGRSETVYTVAAILVWMAVLALLLIAWSKDPQENALAAACGLLWIWFSFMLWGAFVTRDAERADALRGFSFWCFGVVLAAVGLIVMLPIVAISDGAACEACHCESDCCEGYGCGNSDEKNEKK